ncbi:PREDICTED: ubiquitin carboxyl-terminal hydrolase 8-like [Dinoponera quadriceps]|uniref:ubiquitinyl hydrolase 1 n=1 Tax=Dinoponera quadriceps TaxID=609295 RepID=A0A6P3WQ35_DINQU|nr:PREDICTED: ubiquitin carboxyl-terminal hydrolase 8-like [Dinoponera quadriceps]XP_014467889.1 PREDICTED: ubiquitin carboxyl-terminal hydrolase 8-like [Dinoponera quadriceps]XP_014467898.1 PREDICTED: ubiquitin carboxyl-terminal hydrolase 8-like [Dinoponera quadriceps]
MSATVNLKYTCVNDLIQAAKVDYMKKEPRDVCLRLTGMRQKSDAAKKEGDDETAYIMLKRWLDTVEWLKRHRDYKDGKMTYSPNITVDQINEVRNVLADLRQKLQLRYDHSKKSSRKDTIEQMEIEVDGVEATEAYTPSTDIGLKLPETPTDDPIYGDKFISCDQLYSLIKIDGRCLVIDIRQKDQYESSRILSEKCINIPQSEIELGKLASHLLKYLHKDNKRSFQLFKERSAQYVDVVILLDWNTTQETLTPANRLNTLMTILEKWDPGVRYKKITILNGGYQEWLARYPAFATNPKVIVSELDSVANEILDTIEYPEWLNSDEDDELKKSRKLNNAKVFNKNNTDVEMIHGNNKSAPKHARSNSNDAVTTVKPKNFTSHVTISIDGKRSSRGDNVMNGQRINSPDSLPQHKTMSNKLPQNEVNAKPVIDRSNKPVTLKPTYDPRCKEVLRFMKDLHDLTKSKIKLANELFDHEYQLCAQRDDKYRDINDEKYLQKEIKSLKVKLEDMHEMYLKIENEFNEYSKEQGAIKFNLSDDNEKKNLELNLSMMKTEIKSIENKRKKLQEEFMEREHREVSMRQNDNDIHKEPLKTDGSSINTGLERSYSSPNLLQLGDRKAPQVDRTSKPHISPRNQNGSIGNENVKVSLSWGNREERMTPIHGNVHPGITGLKNLGNSCYMNSIIQCLSNTTHLAKYFTDNSYADDLNTSNDNMTQGQVVEEVAQVIKALWRGQYKSISPHDLKVAVGQYKLQFESYEQQDSHEFLTFLLDWMHNDLKKESKMPIEMTNAEKEWDKAMNSQKSIISDLFFGQLRSTITCSSCKQDSTTYETFNSLTMSLSHSNRCTLNDCMEKFVTGQKVNGWKCPKCQTPRDATKKFDFVKLAPIVVVHLNRFAESGGWLEKRNTAVDFPLSGFNLKPYLVSENPTAMSNNIRNYNYTLYAMSNHYGTMDGGHYTAFCKNATQNKWYKYDDQTVTEVSPNQVKSQNTSAYLLFYTSFPNTIM